MKEINEMNIGEIASFVCEHLYNHGVKCVLSGGACVSIYTKNEYDSYDLDFIEIATSDRGVLKKLMSCIGFIEENRYFKHKQTKYYVEFPAGPLSLGAEPVKIINEIIFSTGRLFLLSPTDCVKDRLAAYYYWDDLQSLEQAVLVANCQKIDLLEICRWSKAEGQGDKYNQIKERFKH